MQHWLADTLFWQLSIDHNMDVQYQVKHKLLVCTKVFYPESQLKISNPKMFSRSQIRLNLAKGFAYPYHYYFWVSHPDPSQGDKSRPLPTWVKTFHRYVLPVYETIFVLLSDTAAALILTTQFSSLDTVHMKGRITGWSKTPGGPNGECKATSWCPETKIISVGLPQTLSILLFSLT